MRDLARCSGRLYQNEDATTIVFDLSEVRSMDSTGIGLLMRMSTARAETGRLRIINRAPAVMRVLDMTGVRSQLTIMSRGDDSFAPPRPDRRRQ